MSLSSQLSSLGRHIYIWFQLNRRRPIVASKITQAEEVCFPSTSACGAHPLCLIPCSASCLFSLDPSRLLLSTSLMLKGEANVPSLDSMILLVAMIAAGSSGFFFMTEAVRLGDMSVVSPFRYTRLLFSMAAGILIFGEQVNAVMLIGSAITILSGLYIWQREIVMQS